MDILYLFFSIWLDVPHGYFSFTYVNLQTLRVSIPARLLVSIRLNHNYTFVLAL